MNNFINEYISLSIEQLTKIIDQIKDADLNSRKQFYTLMYHENDSVKIWTAVTLLKTFEDEALSVLKDIEKIDRDIFAIHAKMTIDMYYKGLLTKLIDWNKILDKKN